MGNYLTCVRPIAQPPCITVVHSVTEEVQEIHQPIKVAELMLEYPGHFVCHSSSFSTGCRIAPLSADQELQPTQLYFVFAMNRLHTLLTEREKDFLFKQLSTLKRNKLPRQLDGRVAPWRVNSHSIEEKQGKLESESETEGRSFGIPRSCSAKQSSLTLETDLSTQFMMIRCRSWRPNLQTISETSSLKG